MLDYISNSYYKLNLYYTKDKGNAGDLVLVLKILYLQTVRNLIDDWE